MECAFEITDRLLQFAFIGFLSEAILFREILVKLNQTIIIFVVHIFCAFELFQERSNFIDFVIGILVE